MHQKLSNSENQNELSINTPLEEWVDITLSAVHLSPKQREVADCTARFIVVNAGRRFGKTVLACEELIASATASHGRRCCYIAPTYDQARSIMWAMLKNRVRGFAIKINESLLTVTIPTIDGGESLILLRGWESVETLRGQYFNTIVIDEVSSMRKFWQGWEEVLLPTLTDYNGNALFISTPKGLGQFYDLHSKVHPDWKSFTYTTYDNPYISKESIDVLRSSMTDERFRQEYLAQWVTRADIVFKEFDRSRHIYHTDIDIRQSEIRFAGIDWGYTNPTAMYDIILKDGKYYIQDEYYKTGKTTEESAEFLKTWSPHYVYPDPAEPDRAETLRRLGFYVREVNKDVLAKTDHMRNLFKEGRLFIHSRCKHLIYEIGEYHYDSEAPEHKRDIPVKEDDHGIDAVSYALFMQRTTKVNELKYGRR